MSGSTEAKTSPAERARLRRNQRNSRARKQEYIRDLEQRWSECVRLGVQASVEIQREARRTYEENKHLRSIIAELGMSHETLQERLRSASSADSAQTHMSKCGFHNLTLACGQCSTSTAPGGGPGHGAENPDLSRLHEPNLPPAPGLSLSNNSALLDTQEKGTLSDTFQTWDPYSWLNDLSDIHAAYGIEAQARFDSNQNELFSDHVFADHGLLEGPPATASQTDPQRPLQEHVFGPDTQLKD